MEGRAKNPRLWFSAFIRLIAPDQARRIALQSQGPVPFLSAFDGGKSDIAAIRQRAVDWIGPRYPAGKKFHKLPVREENLNLAGVSEFERTQPQPFCFEDSCHTTVSFDKF